MKLKHLLIYLFLFVSLYSCQKESLNTTTPLKTIGLFFHALKNKNGQAIYDLIDKTSRIKLEKDLKQFLLTIKKIQPQNESITQTLKYNEKDFFVHFMNLPAPISISPKQNVSLDITSVKMYDNNSKATVNLLIQGQIKVINLIKDSSSNKWFIAVSNLNLLPDTK